MRAYIPPNFDDDGGFFWGLVKKRNAVEAGVYLGILYILFKISSIIGDLKKDIQMVQLIQMVLEVISLHQLGRQLLILQNSSIIVHMLKKVIHIDFQVISLEKDTKYLHSMKEFLRL